MLNNFPPDYGLPHPTFYNHPLESTYAALLTAKLKASGRGKRKVVAEVAKQLAERSIQDPESIIDVVAQFKFDNIFSSLNFSGLSHDDLWQKAAEIVFEAQLRSAFVKTQLFPVDVEVLLAVRMINTPGSQRFPSAAGRCFQQIALVSVQELAKRLSIPKRQVIGDITNEGVPGIEIRHEYSEVDVSRLPAVKMLSFFVDKPTSTRTRVITVDLWGVTRHFGLPATKKGITEAFRRLHPGSLWSADDFT